MSERLHPDPYTQAGADGVRYEHTAEGHAYHIGERTDGCWIDPVTAAQIAFRSPKL